MSGESDRQTKTLRHAVARRLADDPAPEPGGEEADSRRLLQELRIHQIELEIQNEALRDAHLQAENALALSLRLYEHAPVAYVTLGRDGAILQINRAGLKLLEMTALPARPVRLEAIVTDQSRPEIVRVLDKILAGETISGLKVSLRASDGSPGKVVILEGLPDPQGSGSLVALIDISELQRTQEALRHATVAAERASAAKTRFLGAVSHDLRQPLQTMYLMSGILARQTVDPRTQGLIAGLERAQEAMTGMLDILLDINEIESGFVQPKLRAFSLHPLFAQLEREFSYHAEAKGLQIHQVPCRHFIQTDEGLLTQILRNILSNALKYTRHGKVLLGVRHRGSTLQIEVWDTGIGIPEDQLEAIFEEFHQLDNPGRERSRGLGLGLAIVRRQADLLNHPLRVRSKVGQGTVFSIEVPLAELGAIPEENAVVPVERQQASLRHRTVLLVEDNPAIATLLERLLIAGGAVVICAPDGKTALARVRAAAVPPDLLVTDYTLPHDMTGLEMVDAVREALSRPVPAIVLSGDVSSGTAKAIAEHGGCLRLIKPVTAETFLSAIPVLPPPEHHRPALETESQRPTVFVVDDDIALRAAMGGLFSEHGWSVEDYADAETFLASVSPTRHGCLIVDAVMPGMGGIALLRRLQSGGWPLKTIVMTGHGDVTMAVAAMKAGAADFIAKPADSSELLVLVAHALSPQEKADPDCVRRCEAIRRIAGLTPREHQILDLLLAGHSNKVVAYLLTISQRTVENHRATIMHKTGSKTLLDLFRTVLDAGVCPPAIAPLPLGQGPAPR